MYSQGKKKQNIGIVQIDIKRNSYRLRFTYPEKNRHEFIIAKATDEGWATALKAAQLMRGC